MSYSYSLQIQFMLCYLLLIILCSILFHFSVIYSMIGMILKLKEAKTLMKNDDTRRRSAALALQICILNGISLLYCSIAAFCYVIEFFALLANFANFYQKIWWLNSIYIQTPRFVVAVCNSNIGFIFHYRYSRMYRDAAREIFAKFYQKIRSRLFCCRECSSQIKVQPTNEQIELESA